ncbi:PAK-box/P21-Rho-binding protein [Sarocladium implicatum]|nr:PAK-box/P21-Rho-binding protein [Sarocladium implicatum]
MPYYSEYHTSRRKGIDIKTQPSSTTSSMLDDGTTGRQSMAEMMEPAIDGPPSPERLRQLSKQAKRASHLRRLPGHRTASSSSSSFRANSNADWETTLENMSLGRKSSARSNSSSNGSRDRESVQFLSRGLFQRKNKANRESKSSSGSSLYSAETSTNESFVAGAKETLSVPTLFSRRKPTRDESSAAASRKLQISGPFNFEHVSSSRREQVTDTSNVGTPGPTSAPAMTLEAHHSYSGFPSPETPRTHQFGPMTAPLQQRPGMVGRHTAPAPSPRRLVKHVRSQDQLRASPPRAPARPPRSPKEPASPSPFPPVPPPRVSSQAFDNFPASFDRPQTSGGFRRPQPFSSPNLEEEPLPPATSYGYMPPADFDSFEANSNRFSHAITTPDDGAWPLSSPESPPATYESPLADVPEEEEGPARRSRMSLASNKSSLRGSQSVPMLRSFANSQRPMSGTSDTLGCFDDNSGSAKSQRQSAGQRDSAAPNDNWEDCIDYCYEHEADANFDYQWERPSLDAERTALATALVDDELAEARTTPTSSRLTPGPGAGGNITQFLDDSPDRSDTFHPIDSLSGLPANGNNFSLPRKDRSSHLKLRPMSCASSFKESHGFNLSPSLLIPGDYHQQMLLSTADGSDIDFDSEIPSLPYRNPEESQFEASAVFQQRSSTSTTESASTAQSDSTNGRHVSANSSWTSSTRLTASTTSLTKLAAAVAEREEPLPTASAPEFGKEAPERQIAAAEVEVDAVPDLVPFPTAPSGRKSHHKSHASESITREDAAAVKSAEAQKTRRGRARTTSLSAQAPPVGQYALFPRAYVKGAGDRI